MKLKAVILLAAVVVMLAGAMFADDSAAVYKSNCAMWDGANCAGDTQVGKSMVIKDLASNGINRIPAFKSSPTPAQIDGLAKFIHTGK